jgi:Predicted redox protein, regulator of disulfide bond formation
LADYPIDALGDFCPIPVLKVQALIPKLGPQDRIILVTDHSCTVAALKEEMLRKRLKIRIEEVDNGIWQITIYKPS